MYYEAYLIKFTQVVSPGRSDSQDSFHGTEVGHKEYSPISCPLNMNETQHLPRNSQEMTKFS